MYGYLIRYGNLWQVLERNGGIFSWENQVNIRDVPAFQPITRLPDVTGVDELLAAPPRLIG
jgi:hypothetical protein